MSGREDILYKKTGNNGHGYIYKKTVDRGKFEVLADRAGKW
jgi:hypothetical protein